MIQFGLRDILQFPKRDTSDGSGDKDDKDKDDIDDKNEDDKDDKDDDKGDKLKRKSKPDESDEDISEDDTKAAIQLFKALRDPDTGLELIETLARRAGLLEGRDGPIKKTRAETADKLESVTEKFLKEALGDKYKEFATTVGPVFDKAIKHFIEQKFGEDKSLNTQDKWESNVDKFIESHVMTPKVERAMMELIEDSPPNLSKRGFDAQKYLGRVYKIACSELGIEPKSKRSQVESEADEIPTFRVRERPREVTLDDAVDAAMRGIRFRRKDE